MAPFKSQLVEQLAEIPQTADGIVSNLESPVGYSASDWAMSRTPISMYSRLALHRSHHDLVAQLELQLKNEDPLPDGARW